jgi:hypothetical protein
MLIVGLGALLTAALAGPQGAPVRAEEPAKVAVKQPDAAAQAAFGGLVAAIQANDYARFLAPMDEPMKQAVTKPVFDTVVTQYAPRLKQGYTTGYFGDMKKQGYKVHVWKMSFEDGGDDVMAELSMKDGKVGGFFLR